MYLLQNRHELPKNSTDRHPVSGLDNPSKPAPGRLNCLGFQWSKRWWGGSGISWTICKSFVPYSRQINAPAPHHSVWRLTNSLKALKATDSAGSTEGSQKWKFMGDSWYGWTSDATLSGSSTGSFVLCSRTFRFSVFTSCIFRPRHLVLRSLVLNFALEMSGPFFGPAFSASLHIPQQWTWWLPTICMW